jgi:two-component system chemotaxis response regulator CheY
MAHILVVDDSSTMREIVGSFLSKNGFEVTVATDGRDGLAKLKQDPEIRLVLSDVNMPNMDGLTFLKTLKTLPAHKFVPVIMLTTESQEAKKAEGKAAGARAWITKPFQPSQLVDAVNKLCV